MNASLTVWDKVTKQCPQTTTFEDRINTQGSKLALEIRNTSTTAKTSDAYGNSHLACVQIQGTETPPQVHPSPKELANSPEVLFFFFFFFFLFFFFFSFLLFSFFSFFFSFFLLFFEDRKAEADLNRRPSAYQPNALPLGQTGSPMFRTSLRPGFIAVLDSTALQSRNLVGCSFPVL